MGLFLEAHIHVDPNHLLIVAREIYPIGDLLDPVGEKPVRLAALQVNIASQVGHAHL